MDASCAINDYIKADIPIQYCSGSVFVKMVRP